MTEKAHHDPPSYFRHFTPERHLHIQVDQIYEEKPGKAVEIVPSPEFRKQPASVLDLGEVADYPYKTFKFYLSLRKGRWNKNNIFT